MQFRRGDYMSLFTFSAPPVMAFPVASISFPRPAVVLQPVRTRRVVAARTVQARMVMMFFMGGIY
jgi:hypothetical protein